MQGILAKLPSPDLKVSIISIVGAFRTGKSFMLNIFLRYLRHVAKHQDDLEVLKDQSENWLFNEGDELSEGNLNNTWSTPMKPSNDTSEVINNIQNSKTASFAWRGGYERQTTGIWMWSEPFILKNFETNEQYAVLLMDTQGMFDNQTTMTLTAQIFGLSTLVSSFQIYNVEKRIGEDNLQHLALFSEYGRMALASPSSEKVCSCASCNLYDDGLHDHN